MHPFVCHLHFLSKVLAMFIKISWCKLILYAFVMRFSFIIEFNSTLCLFEQTCAICTGWVHLAILIYLLIVLLVLSYWFITLLEDPYPLFHMEPACTAHILLSWDGTVYILGQVSRLLEKEALIVTPLSRRCHILHTPRTSLPCRNPWAEQSSVYRPRS